MRDGLLHAMRQSPVYEDKLLFGALLREKGLGRALLEAMARAGGVTRSEILALVDRTPMLEVYLPVPDHRASRDGSEEVIVATTLSEIETPFGVDLDGNAVELSLEEAPEFDIRLAGTEDLDSFAEVHHLRRIQNSVWDNKEEGDRAEIGLNLFDIDVDMGSRVAIQCFEDDPDDDDAYNLSGTTTFDVGPVSFEFNFEDFFGDGDDNCGGYELLLKTSNGEYTTFRQDKDGVPDGTSDLEWLTYGIDLTI